MVYLKINRITIGYLLYGYYKPIVMNFYLLLHYKSRKFLYGGYVMVIFQS